MTRRPQRLCLSDEIGRTQTLDSGPGAFEDLTGPRSEPEAAPLLFLGLGPEPARLLEWFPEAAPGATYVECPDFAAALGPDWAAQVPPAFRRLTPEALTPDLLRSSRILAYRRNLRLFPSFWAPVSARLDPADPAPAADLFAQPVVWLPGGESGLLLRELERACTAHGLTPRRVPEDPSALAAMLHEERPALVLSVNFRGLDPFGRVYHLLTQAGARVAAWCVDNPFHLLSAVQGRFWTHIPLFVTDHWFVEPLRRLGAGQVEHLPLAADPAFAAPGPLPAAAGGLGNRLVFVGRSAFPDQEAFFAGCRPPADALGEAERLLSRGQRPDFGWWLARLGIATPWPGREIRTAGCGADRCGALWRTRCLEAALPALTVFGDEGWQGLLPAGSDLRPPLDYYNGLSTVYREAGCCLNLTGMLLPSGLTQRHFDVWLAGGFLLTDHTAGLDIFPEDLWRPVSFERPSDIPELFARFAPGSRERRELAAAWREELLDRHTCFQRLTRVLEVLGLDRHAV